MRKLVSLEEAVVLCHKETTPLETEWVKIETACQRVSAVQVAAEADVPAFSTSAVDGYTLCREDLKRLKTGETLWLAIVGQIGAGQRNIPPFAPGQTLRIMTGAMLPENTAAVIKQENANRHQDLLKVEIELKEKENIFSPGRDIPAGQVVIEKGQVLTPQSLEYAATCGRAEIEVYRIPRIYVINTGSELVLPGTALNPGQIYNSNRSLVSGLISRAGAIPVMGPSSLTDNLGLMRAEITKGLSTGDMMVITGGTGKGDYDVVSAAIHDAGARELFNGLDITPGKTASAAVWEGRLIYNFTGNPRAVSLLFEVLARPALEQLMGRKQAAARWIPIALANPLRKVVNRRNLRRAELLIHDGLVTAQLLDEGAAGTAFMPVILDIQPGQGKKGDIVRALISSGV